ncbi:MAG: hypothetical protein LLF97_10095 [Planctomycetaceae bacterium]|nr:hypothetical protein [Planctomycetaceae bacterium]
MPRFVILRHDSLQGVHFDWMFEVGETLKTWSLPKPPTEEASLDGQRLADHRRAYLDYEGPVSDGRGDVTRWDCGDYTLLREGDDVWTVLIAGKKLRGRAELQRVHDDRWRATFLSGE